MRWRVAALAAAAVSLAGCGSPAQRVEDRAAELELARHVVFGAPYRHLVYFRRGVAKTQELHVYIEHDGSPWLEGTRVAADPTPRNPLALELLALDSSPVLYLGRPCYFAIEGDDACSPLAWTHRRYSEEVVSSMARVLRAFLAAQPYDKIVLIGHSGGGTLALLLAERITETVAVVTVAGNLDIERWTKRHGYSTLEGSLNPATRPPLPARIAERHYAGGRDRNVPTEIVRAYAAARERAVVVEIPEFDHVCCWTRLWPTILADLESATH
jgi:hypothetical protein